jgi:uncharacterized membrane protein YfcA
MTPVVQVLLLVCAGVAAGLAGTIAGLASLFSYPALLAIGLPATAANVTNTVALAVSSIGAVGGSRPELIGQARVARPLSLLCAGGGALGAGLLLLTPSGTFERVAPLLIAGASLVLLASPARVVRMSDPSGPGHPGWTAAGALAVSVYGGYFGAAAGVLMLALLVRALPETLIRANALKNLLLGLANVVAAVGFALFGPVAWSAALPLTAGLLIGSWTGPAVARRLPSEPLRVGIALAGLGLAVKLGRDAFGV